MQAQKQRKDFENWLDFETWKPKELPENLLFDPKILPPGLTVEEAREKSLEHMAGIDLHKVRTLVEKGRWRGRVTPCRWVFDNPRGAGWRARIVAQTSKMEKRRGASRRLWTM